MGVVFNVFFFFFLTCFSGARTGHRRLRSIFRSSVDGNLGVSVLHSRFFPPHTFLRSERGSAVLGPPSLVPFFLLFEESVGGTALCTLFFVPPSFGLHEGKHECIGNGICYGFVAFTPFLSYSFGFSRSFGGGDFSDPPPSFFFSLNPLLFSCMF